MAHAAPGVLVQKLADAAERVEVGATYVHYKRLDRSYEVTELAILEATEEVAVVYRALYGDELTFIRPLSNWLEPVTLEDGKRVARFMRI